MSDFEMLTVFNEAFDFLITSFTTFLSIVFAFLVASSFLAGRLSRTLAGIAAGLFSVASIFFILLTYAVAANVGIVAEQIKLAVAEGRSSLAWVHFVARDAPIGTILPLVAVLMALTYGAALVFFFHQRRVAMRAH